MTYSAKYLERSLGSLINSLKAESDLSIDCTAIKKAIDNLNFLIEDSLNDPIRLSCYSLNLSKNIDYLLPSAKFQSNIRNIINEAQKIYHSCKENNELDLKKLFLLGDVIPDAIFDSWGMMSGYAWNLEDESIPPEDMLSFWSHPLYTRFKKGTMLRRIISQNGNPRGHWWFKCTEISHENLNISEWRNKNAIPAAWCGGTHYVEFELENEQSFFKGVAAWQPDPSNKHILSGGGEQIWISEDRLQDFKISEPTAISWSKNTDEL